MAHKRSHRVNSKNYIPIESYHSEETSDDGSLDKTEPCSEENPESDSSDPEWIDEVSDAGDLFYVGSTLETVEKRLPPNEADRSTYRDVLNANSSNDKSKKKNQSGKLRSFIKINRDVKNGDLGPREVPGAEDTGGFNAPKVTFQEPRGELKEVFLDVDPNRHNYGRRATLCEVLFGIIPGHFHGNKTTGRNGEVVSASASASAGSREDNDHRLMVLGLIPDGEAMCSETIKIGDWLRSVNDVEVNFLNIQRVLSSITSPAKVKLTLQTLANPSGFGGMKNNQQERKSRLAQLVSRNSHGPDQDSLLSLANAHCLVLHLTLDGITELASGKQDILYQFPPYDSKLVQVRGMFVTLNHTLPDITASNPLSSTLIVEDKLVHVGYAQEGNETFVLALPDDCISLIQLRHLIKDIVSLLRYQYRTLHQAFTDPDNKSALDHVFAVTLQQHLTGGWNGSLRIFQDILPAAHWLPLPSHIEMEIHSTLGDFEAADFVDLSDDYYDAQRTYTILGTCLFYRGYLLANHLPKDDLLDVLLYLKHHGVLLLIHSEALSRIVIWKEIFPSRRHQRDQNISTDGDVEETSGRWFLMVVGKKQSLLAVLLESGGCAIKVEGKPSPDPFYIDQADATLSQLESFQIPEACESRLKLQAPALANIDWFMQASKGAKDDGSSNRARESGHPESSFAKSAKKSQNELTSILKRSSSSSNIVHVMGSNPALYENESDTSHSIGVRSAASSTSDDTNLAASSREPSNQSRMSGSDADSRASSESAPYKTTKKSRTLPGNSTIDLHALYKNLPDNDKTPSKLTTGCENILFHYIQLDSADGVFICPQESDSNSMLSTEVLRNFQVACLSIQQVFHNSLKYTEMKKNKQVPRMGMEYTLTAVKEHGVLFQCSLPPRPNQKKSPPTVSYWVVGRLFEGVNPQEVYVCFLDSIPQNVVELAFRLGFGITV